MRLDMCCAHWRCCSACSAGSGRAAGAGGLCAGASAGHSAGGKHCRFADGQQTAAEWQCCSWWFATAACGAVASSVVKLQHGRHKEPEKSGQITAATSCSAQNMHAAQHQAWLYLNGEVQHLSHQAGRIVLATAGSSSSPACPHRIHQREGDGGDEKRCGPLFALHAAHLQVGQQAAGEATALWERQASISPSFVA